MSCNSCSRIFNRESMCSHCYRNPGKDQGHCKWCCSDRSSRQSLSRPPTHWKFAYYIWDSNTGTYVPVFIPI